MLDVDVIKMVEDELMSAEEAMETLTPRMRIVFVEVDKDGSDGRRIGTKDVTGHRVKELALGNPDLLRCLGDDAARAATDVRFAARWEAKCEIERALARAAVRRARERKRLRGLAHDPAHIAGD